MFETPQKTLLRYAEFGKQPEARSVVGVRTQPWVIKSAMSALAWGMIGCGGATQTDTPNLDDLPQLTFSEELRLGSRDDPDVGFSLIGDVDIDRDGSLYVMELLDQHIRVFDSNGVRIRTIGGAGEGPGEFGMVASFGVTEDTVWALDMGLRRITLFDREGNVLSTGRMEGVAVALQSPSQEGVVMPRGLRADGVFTGDMIGTRSRRDTDPTGIGANDTVMVPRVLFNPSGDVIDTVGWDRYQPPDRPEPQRIEKGPTRYDVPPPPGDEPLEVNEPYGRWKVHRRRAQAGEIPVIRIHRLTEIGDTLFSRTFPYTPVPYSDVVLDTLAWRSARIPGGGLRSITRPRPTPPGVDIDEVQRSIRAAMSFPEFQAGVERATAGKDGTLWLLQADKGGPLRRWLIVLPDGTPRGHLEIPRDWQLLWVSADAFVVVEKDEWDVPWLLRFRIGS